MTRWDLLQFTQIKLTCSIVLVVLGLRTVTPCYSAIPVQGVVHCGSVFGLWAKC